MTIIPYVPDKDFSYFLKEKIGINPDNMQDLLAQLDSLFALNQYNGYQKALFISFLVYVLGDLNRFHVVVARMAQLASEEYLPNDYAEFLNVWLGGTTLETESGLEQQFTEKIAPLLKQLQIKTVEKTELFVQQLKKSFDGFYQKVKEELFLKEMQIHSDELLDQQLENEAVRWEYKYLGREDDKIKQRREIYLKRQSECLKSN